MSGLYEAVGGKEACRQLSEALYARVGHDPLLRPLFPGKSLRCAIEAFAAFLAQFLDGPSEDAQHRWWLSLRESHLRFRIGRKERDAWMKGMIGALDDVPMEDSVRGALRDFFEGASAYLVNQGQAPGVANGCIHEGISKRWDAQRALDEAIAAIRYGDADRALRLASGSLLQTRFAGNRAVFANFLALMIASGAVSCSIMCGRNCFAIQHWLRNAATTAALCCMRHRARAVWVWLSYSCASAQTRMLRTEADTRRCIAWGMNAAWQAAEVWSALWLNTGRT